MQVREALWGVGLLAVLFGALTVFRRFRRRTEDYRQAALFKRRLPLWVGQLETTILCLLLTPALMIVVRVVFVLRDRFGGGDMSGVAAIYFALGLLLGAVPIAMLGANVVSWLLPSVRRANLKAMEGLQVSFWSLNRGLLWFAAATVPLGAALLALAILSPWR